MLKISVLIYPAAVYFAVVAFFAALFSNTAGKSGVVEQGKKAKKKSWAMFTPVHTAGGSSVMRYGNGTNKMDIVLF